MDYEKKSSVILNAQLLDALPESLTLVERGLYYGDTLFESIRVFGGRLPLWEWHWARLLQGMTMLGYNMPTDWSARYFKEHILRIAPDNARVRLIVWRASGGLYAPENNDPNFLLTAQPLSAAAYEWDDQGVSLGVCRSVRLPMDALSGLKTGNALRYVVAAREAHAKGWDDALLLNAQGRVCEATGSNLFWLKDSVFFTPPQSEGCVTGTLQSLLRALIPKLGYFLRETPITFPRLMQADEMFLTNAARGIRWVNFCEKKQLNNLLTKELYIYLIKEMQQMDTNILTPL